MKRKLKTFLDSTLTFGDYILFQEYTSDNNGKYNISKPILAIYLGSFVADQTLGFNYVKWVNDNHITYITNEHVTDYPTLKEAKIESHIEWSDYIDILATWNTKPKWKEILSKYRNQNTNLSINNRYIIHGK